MTSLTLQLLVRGSRLRTVLVVGCTGVATTLLLLVLTLVLLPTQAEEALYEVVADPATRPGFTFAVGVLVLLPLLLLRQAVRFGTSAREQRLAGLRLAGATPGDIRRLSTLEVALPAFLGGALGVAGFFLLRLVLGGSPSAWSRADRGPAGCVDDGNGNVFCGYAGGSVDQLVPQSVVPPWWAVLVIVLGIGAAGALVGARVGRRLALSPHGVTRRRPSRPPRPWGLGGVALAAVLLPLDLLRSVGSSDVLVLASLVVAVVSVLSLGPWVAHRAALRALWRTADTATLLAAGRLAADPRSAGRAAAAVGAIGLVVGNVVGILLLMISDGGLDVTLMVALALVVVCVLAALVVVGAAVAVHGLETLNDDRRSVAAQAAQGVDVEVTTRSLRDEALLVAVPLGVAGAVLGAVGQGVLLAINQEGAIGISLVTAGLAAVVTAWLVRTALTLTARILRPAVVDAARPEHLRTA